MTIEQYVPHERRETAEDYGTHLASGSLCVCSSRVFVCLSEAFCKRQGGLTSCWDFMLGQHVSMYVATKPHKQLR